MIQDAAEDRLQALLDREAIRDVLMRYARAIDRCDRVLLEGVYWPQAIDNHGNFSGLALEFIEWVIPRLRGMDQTTHLIGNILIHVNGSRASVESYFEAYHRIRRANRAPYDVFLGGRYVDQMERRDAEWRILVRDVAFDWVREFEDSADWSKDVLGLQFKSNRIESDLSYRLDWS